MPIPLVPIAPVIAHAAPALLAAVGPFWWCLPVLGLITGVLLMLTTEWAKAKFGKARTDIDIWSAQQNVAGAERDDLRDLMAQNLDLLRRFDELTTERAELRANTKIQDYRIERLSVDVAKLQQENDSLKPLKSKVCELENQVRDLTHQLRDRDYEIEQLRSAAR